jgi:hypothetical protein
MHGGTDTEADPDPESSSQGKEGREARQEEGRKGYKAGYKEGDEGYQARYKEGQEGGKKRDQKSQAPGSQGDEETLILRGENVGGGEGRPRLQRPPPRTPPWMRKQLCPDYQLV